jgi:hypothetical protein
MIQTKNAKKIWGFISAADEVDSVVFDVGDLYVIEKSEEADVAAVV